MVRCQAPGCDDEARVKFCSDRCGQRVRSAAYMRRQRQDPGFVAREREYQRTYLPGYKRERYRTDSAFRDAVKAEARARMAYRRALKVAGGDNISAAALRAHMEAWDCRCYVCAVPAEEWDHVLAITRGGTHTFDNLAPICRDCNRGVGGKSDHLLFDWLPGRLEQLRQERP